MSAERRRTAGMQGRATAPEPEALPLDGLARRAGLRPSELRLDRCRVEGPGVLCATAPVERPLAMEADPIGAGEAIRHLSQLATLACVRRTWTAGPQDVRLLRAHLVRRGVAGTRRRSLSALAHAHAPVGGEARAESQLRAQRGPMLYEMSLVLQVRDAVDEDHSELGRIPVDAATHWPVDHAWASRDQGVARFASAHEVAGGPLARGPALERLVATLTHLGGAMTEARRRRPGPRLVVEEFSLEVHPDVARDEDDRPVEVRARFDRHDRGRDHWSGSVTLDSETLLTASFRTSTQSTRSSRRSR